jgi:saccharopine dehydrogenase-like NADP-dependent oxidoreductase
MRVLVVGAGGVGSAVARTVARWDLFTYLDMAMSLSRPHASDPYRQPGVKLGDEQFALAGEWERRGLLALCGIGVEPGLSDVFARYAADRLFASIDEIGVRDGANLVVEGTSSPRRSPSGRRSRSA